MSDYLLYIGLALVLLVLLLSRRKERRPRYEFTGELPALPETWHLFTPGELVFLRVLDGALGGEYRIFGKVRLEDICGAVRKRPDPLISWRSAALMHVDFVLCDKQDLSILACIELDDKTHYYDDVKRRDAMKDRVIKSAGIPLLRVRARAVYDVDDLRARVLSVLPVGGNGHQLQP